MMILYVDQHEDSRHMLAILLSRAGHKVVTAATPAEALTIARKHWFTLFILENRLPEISGIELCQQIRSLHPRTPIIFYSSNDYNKDIEDGLAAGAQRYLTKPKDLVIIKEVVAELLQKTPARYRPVEMQGDCLSLIASSESPCRRFPANGNKE